METRHPGHVAVLGQLARDLVLQVDAVPDAGGSSPVRQRRELLGGKGANHALGLRQLGNAVELIAVAGDDPAGASALHEAVEQGIGVACAARRGTTALLVDVVDSGGARRLLEHVPGDALLTADDVHRASAAITAADTVCLQLQQPAEALLAAAEIATRAQARIVLDGAIEGDARDELLTRARVVRADAAEAELLTGREIGDLDAARRAAAELLRRGPELVAIGVPGAGDLIAWHGDDAFLRFADSRVVDVTGGGDAFLAGLVTGVRRGWSPERSGRLAAAAASATVQLLGGRPELGRLRPDGAQ